MTSYINQREIKHDVKTDISRDTSVVRFSCTTHLLYVVSVRAVFPNCTSVPEPTIHKYTCIGTTYTRLYSTHLLAFTTRNLCFRRIFLGLFTYSYGILSSSKTLFRIDLWNMLKFIHFLGYHNDYTTMERIQNFTIDPAGMTVNICY